jgi:hypothetical protein
MWRPEWGDELRPDRCHIIYVRAHRVGKKYVVVANQFTDYACFRKENASLITKLVRAGNIVILTHEDGADSFQYDDHRYPGVTPKKMLAILEKARKKRVKLYNALTTSA